MTLSEQQRLFMRLMGEFLVWIYANGMEVTEGEAWRSEHEAAWDAQQGIGIGNSLHGIRLAEDLNLFLSGVYQTDTEAYRPLGDKWKSMHPLARWGGDFSKPDGNHFSLEWQGVR